MAKYLGKDGKKIGKIGREIYYEAFEANLVRERPLDTLSPNTKKNIITKAKFASTMKFTDYCMVDDLTKFFPDIKGAKMKRSSITKTNKNSFLPMHKKYYKRSSLISFGEFKLPGNKEVVLREDSFECSILNKENMYQGLLVSFQCHFANLTKINDISELLLETYPDFQEGDIIHCYGTFCGNCLAKNSPDEPIEIRGNCNKKYIHRQFKINKHDSRRINEIGFETGWVIIDYEQMIGKSILVPICNKYKYFEADESLSDNPGSLFFWVESKNGGIHNKGGLLQIDTLAYRMIKGTLNNDNTKTSILNSWKILEYPIIAE